MAALADHLRSLGPHARAARTLIAYLQDHPDAQLDEVVEATGAPRRDVEHLRRLGLDEELPPAARSLDLDLAVLREQLTGMPAPQRDLDHVPATAETVLRRATWLDETYELAQSRVLLLGDHDGTALALQGRCARLAVADIDHDVLRVLDGPAEPFWCDLRAALPAPLHGAFDLVVTDPPYTPEGIGLFAARAIEAIEHHEPGRIVLAYGFPPSAPALGLKVQDQLHRLALVTEVVLPGFHHYRGAQAIGSRASQYVLRPTRGSAKAAARLAERVAPALYTHGRQSVESSDRGGGRRNDGGTDPTAGDVHAAFAARTGTELLDLLPHAGRSLVHAVIAAGAEATDVLVDNETPGVRSAAEQAATTAAIGAEVRFRRSWEGSRATVVEVRGRPRAADPWTPLHRLAGSCPESAVPVHCTAPCDSGH